MEISLDNEVRGLSKSPNNLHDLMETIRSVYPDNLPSKMSLYYLDHKGDRVNIQNEGDYKLMVDTPPPGSQKALRVYVGSSQTSSSTENKQSGQNDAKQKTEGKIQHVQQKLQAALDEVKKNKYTEKLERLRLKLANPEQYKADKLKANTNPKQKLDTKIQQVQQKLQDTKLDENKRAKNSDKLQKLQEKLKNVGNTSQQNKDSAQGNSNVEEKKEETYKAQTDKKGTDQKTEGKIQQIQQKLQAALDEVKKNKYVAKLERLRLKQANPEQYKADKAKDTTDPKQKIEEKIRNLQQKMEKPDLDATKKGKNQQKLDGLKAKLAKVGDKDQGKDKK